MLGVTGSIAAYKIANLASMLVKLNADVHVIMTQNATHFITPMTFETLTNNKCIVDTFDRNFNFDVKHVSLAKKGDLFLVAPCTANVIGKVALGICDDMLTTTIMATKAPVLFAPAMNSGMWENPILQDNLQKLQHYGYHIISPVVGRLACGDTGSGKMPSEETLLSHILLHLAKEKDLSGKKLLITAGPTQEAIDPVRFITNHSSGKMGYALAKMAYVRRRHLHQFHAGCHHHVQCGGRLYAIHLLRSESEEKRCRPSHPTDAHTGHPRLPRRPQAPWTNPCRLLDGDGKPDRELPLQTGIEKCRRYLCQLDLFFIDGFCR